MTERQSAHLPPASRLATVTGPEEDVEQVLSIVGFSLVDGGAQSNAAFIVVRMKPFEDRTAPGSVGWRETS